MAETQEERDANELVSKLESISSVEAEDEHVTVIKCRATAKEAVVPDPTLVVSQSQHQKAIDKSAFNQAGEAHIDNPKSQSAPENTSGAQTHRAGKTHRKQRTCEDTLKEKEFEETVINLYDGGMSLQAIKIFLGLQRIDPVNGILAPYLTQARERWRQPTTAIIDTPSALKKQLPGLANIERLLVKVEGDKLIATSYTGQA